MTLRELWIMAEAKGRMERLKMLQLNRLIAGGIKEEEVVCFLSCGEFAEVVLQPPTPAEIDLLNKSYGGG